MKCKKYCVIMAGSIGSSFWPKSRKSKPKQFLDILGTGRSFLRHTFDRFVEMIPAENFLVVTNVAYRDIVLEQIPELCPDQILCEPIGRNTAPCVCYAAYSLLKRDPDAEMIVTPADHFISDEQGLRSIVAECFDFASTHDALMTVGVRPTQPETGYGYIQVSDNSTISRAKCFTEKPMFELAQAFVQCGEFFWNSGIFVWSAKNIISAIEEYMPEMHALFSSVTEYYGTDQECEQIARIFAECRSISIDYGVMEKAKNVYVRVGDFGWSDVGTWSSVHRLTQCDEQENVTVGEVQLYNTSRSYVSMPKGKVAVVSGLDDFIVVDTADALLVCPRSEERNIKKFVDEMNYKIGDKHI